MSGLKIKIKPLGTPSQGPAPGASLGATPTVSDTGKKRKLEEPASASRSAGEPPKKQAKQEATFLGSAPSVSQSGLSNVSTPVTNLKLKVKIGAAPSSSGPASRSVPPAPTLAPPASAASKAAKQPRPAATPYAQGSSYGYVAATPSSYGGTPQWPQHTPAAPTPPSACSYGLATKAKKQKLAHTPAPPAAATPRTPATGAASSIIRIKPATTSARPSNLGPRPASAAPAAAATGKPYRLLPLCPGVARLHCC